MMSVRRSSRLTNKRTKYQEKWERWYDERRLLNQSVSLSSQQKTSLSSEEQRSGVTSQKKARKESVLQCQAINPVRIRISQEQSTPSPCYSKYKRIMRPVSNANSPVSNSGLDTECMKMKPVVLIQKLPTSNSREHFSKGSTSLGNEETACAVRSLLAENQECPAYRSSVTAAPQDMGQSWQETVSDRGRMQGNGCSSKDGSALSGRRKLSRCTTADRCALSGRWKRHGCTAVSDGSAVSGRTKGHGCTAVKHGSAVSGNTQQYLCATVSDGSAVSGRTKGHGCTAVSDGSAISGNTQQYHCATASDDSVISGRTKQHGCTTSNDGAALSENIDHDGCTTASDASTFSVTSGRTKRLGYTTANDGAALSENMDHGSCITASGGSALAEQDGTEQPVKKKRGRPPKNRPLASSTPVQAASGKSQRYMVTQTETRPGGVKMMMKEIPLSKGEKRRGYRCSICAFHTTDKAAKAEHIKSCHSHRCPSCQHRFSSLELLEAHKVACAAENRFQCAMCQRSFLKNHRKQHIHGQTHNLIVQGLRTFARKIHRRDSLEKFLSGIVCDPSLGCQKCHPAWISLEQDQEQQPDEELVQLPASLPYNPDISTMDTQLNVLHDTGAENWLSECNQFLSAFSSGDPGQDTSSGFPREECVPGHLGSTGDWPCQDTIIMYDFDTDVYIYSQNTDVTPSEEATATLVSCQDAVTVPTVSCLDAVTVPVFSSLDGVAMPTVSCQDGVTVPTVSCLDSVNVPTISCLDSVNVPTVSCQDAATVPTVSCQDGVTVPTVSCLDSVNVPTVSCLDSVNVPTVSCQDAATVPTVSCLDAVTVPTVSCLDGVNVPTVSCLDGVNVPTVSCQDAVTMPTISYEDGVTLPAINYQDATIVPAISADLGSKATDSGEMASDRAVTGGPSLDCGGQRGKGAGSGDSTFADLLELLDECDLSCPGMDKVAMGDLDALCLEAGCGEGDGGGCDEADEGGVGTGGGRGSGDGGVPAAQPMHHGPELLPVQCEYASGVRAVMNSASEDSGVLNNASEDSGVMNSASEDSGVVNSASEDSGVVNSASGVCDVMSSASGDGDVMSCVPADSALMNGHLTVHDSGTTSAALVDEARVACQAGSARNIIPNFLIHSHREENSGRGLTVEFTSDFPYSDTEPVIQFVQSQMDDSGHISDFHDGLDFMTSTPAGYHMKTSDMAVSTGIHELAWVNSVRPCNTDLVLTDLTSS